MRFPAALLCSLALMSSTVIMTAQAQPHVIEVVATDIPERPHGERVSRSAERIPPTPKADQQYLSSAHSKWKEKQARKRAKLRKQKAARRAHLAWHREQEAAAAQTQQEVSTAVPEPPPEPVNTGDIASRIAKCESGNRNIKNPNSSASGYFQFLDSTWTSVTGLAPPAMAYSYTTQLQAFYELWDNGAGAGHWAQSRHCWG